MKTPVILVDLDGTLAAYDTWDGSVGPPVPEMLARVKGWISAGYIVRIFTARVGALHLDDATGEEITEASKQLDLINDWCLEHIGRELVITAVKTFDVTEVWDDRAVRVDKNTGRSELHEAHQVLDQAMIQGGSLLERLTAFLDSHVDLSERYDAVTNKYYRTLYHDTVHAIGTDTSVEEDGGFVYLTSTVPVERLYPTDARNLAAMLLRAAEDAQAKQ